MKIIDKVGLGAVVVALITNPLTGQYILTGLDIIFEWIFKHGTYINLAASIVVLVYIIYKMYQSREVINIPEKKKGKKNETN